MKDRFSPLLGRRGFLKAATLGGAAALGAGDAARAGPPGGDAPSAVRPSPTAPDARREQDIPTPDAVKEPTPGSDYMVDAIRAMGIEYVVAMSGSSFDGLQESVVNYGMLTEPKLTWITAVHEDSSVAVCHGYYKATGKPLACMMHSTVGLQHAVMAIFNAWCDRVPILLMTATFADAGRRKHDFDWLHDAADGAALVRDLTKWDDTPLSLNAFAGSLPRALKIALTPPHGPVLLTADWDLQHDPAPPADRPPVPTRPSVAAPAAEQAAVLETARLLTTAERPVLVADRVARTPAGLAAMVELAELLQAPVIDRGGRMNFPWRHPLNQSWNEYHLAQADVVLAMEMTDPQSAFYRPDAPHMPKPIQRDGVKRITLSANDLLVHANYQEFGAYAPVDIAMAADAEATLPALIEAVKSLRTPAQQAAWSDRGKAMAEAHSQALERDRAAAALGWDDSPISTARMCQELHGVLQGEDWCLASGTVFQNHWPQRLWVADRHYNYLGESGGYGIGYASPAALGAALGNRGSGRLTVSIVGDGDLLMGDGVLWTAAHDKIPILWIVHNNRGWRQEEMYLQIAAGRRDRGVERAHIGTTLTNPNIDYKMLATAMGVYAEGPIEDPVQLGPALRRAIAAVKRGEPALVDVVSQAR